MSVINYRIVGGSHDGEWLSVAFENLRPEVRMVRKASDDDLWTLPVVEIYRLHLDFLLLPILVFDGFRS